MLIRDRSSVPKTNTSISIINLIFNTNKRYLFAKSSLNKTLFSYSFVLLPLFLLFPANVLFAQGLTIPSGSTLNVNAGTLVVAGNITNSGTLQTSTGTIKLTGNWVNSSGTYTMNTGTVEFTGTSGTQDITSGGTAVGKRFYNLTHSGAGTARSVTNALDIDNTFTNSGGTFNANGLAMNVAGNWSNSATFTANSNTVTLDGTNQTFTGSTTFYTLSKIVTSAATLTFDDAGTITVSNSLTFNGASGQLLSLRSDNNGTAAALTLQSGGTQSLNYLDVKDNNAGGGLLLVGLNSTNSGNNTNWVFGGTTITWDGSSSTDWDTPANWNLGLVPGSADTAVIADVTNQPVLATNVTVTNLTVNNGATMSLNGKNLTVSSTLDMGNDDSTILLTGAETVSFGTMDTAAGTFEFLGDADGTAENFTITDFGATDYYNLKINDTNATKDTFRTSANLTVAGTLTVASGTMDISTNANTLTTTGTLTVSGGTLTATSGNIDANGAVTISSGTLTAPGSGQSFTIAGNFTHSGGTFTHSSGTVTLDGTNQTINNSTTFYNLTKSVTSAATLTFQSGTTQTIANKITLTGAASNLLTLQSSSAGTQWNINLQTNATQTISYVSVHDSNATGLKLVARNSTDTSDNNTNWAFGSATVTWDGSESTDFDTAQNWDLGLVPIDGDTAIIASVTNDPTMDAAAQVDNLTINSGATLSLGGNNLTVDLTLSNEGSISLFGSETVTIGTIDSNSGTFVLRGDGDGTAENFTIKDFGTTDYYNLTINDTNATKDTFRTNANLTVAGALNVTSGTMDISTNTNTLTTTGTLTVNGGTLTATNGNIDANGSVSISSGTLTAPGSGKSFTVADDWSHSGGTFTHSSGTVTLDTTTETTISNDTTFNNLTSTTTGKTIKFTAGTTQTIAGTLTLQGTEGNLITLRSTTDGSKWDITLSGSAQNVKFLDVKDADANTNTVTCFNCTDSGNNNSNWIFTKLIINVPQSGVVTDQTPTIIGEATANTTINIKDQNGNVVASPTSDNNGNFQIEVTTAITAGSNTLTPENTAATVQGTTRTITIKASPSQDEQPKITSHSDGQRVQSKTPTISGQAAVNATITIRSVVTVGGNNVLTSVGTGTVGADNDPNDGKSIGNFSVALTTALNIKGLNSSPLTVTVGNVASDIVDLSLVDPFGVVFDSVSNATLDKATVTIFKENGTLAQPGVDLNSSDSNPVTTGSDGFYSFLTANANYYITVTREGYKYPSQLSSFPAGRTIVTGSKGETFSVTGTVIEMDQPMDARLQLIRVEKNANKAEARIGDVVTYTVTMENLSDDPLVNVILEDTIPPGFKYIGSRVMLDGQNVSDPTGHRPLIFQIGSFNVGQTRTLKYQLVVGSGVGVGTYDNAAVARFSPTNNIISNTARESVRVIPDPLFDLGTILGKVFFDLNENGIQDPPEYIWMDRETIIESPVPNVLVVMEDGTQVTSDKEGQFSFPALIPGRHVFRLDERTLPEGSFLTTDKVVVVDITPGLTTKLNFGVNQDFERFRPEDKDFFTYKVNVARKETKPEPRLNVSLFREEFLFYDGLMVGQAEFRIFTNYAPFMEAWQLEILDRDTKLVVKHFSGTRLNIHDPISWFGIDRDEKPITSEKNYAYILTVESADGRKDATEEKPVSIKVVDETTLGELLKKRKETGEDEYQQWLREEVKKNALKRQNIILDGETLVIDPFAARIKSIQILSHDKLFADIPLLKRRQLTAQDLIEGKSFDEDSQEKLEIILPKGDYRIQIASYLPKEEEEELSEEGLWESLPEDQVIGDDKTQLLLEGPAFLAPELGDDQRILPPTGIFTKDVTIGDDYLFFVGMGDGQVGYAVNRGNIEPLEKQDKFREEFWSEGKMAYFLKGKIKGKYLITSSFDLDRDKKELFRSLDPDEYYPVYGDESSRDYSATNTQGPLYLVIQWDKSSLLWGNYEVGFEDTEFAQFNRTLYGGKVAFETLGTTRYGDPRSKTIVFRARAQQKAAHNEYLATGGSLYYTKHRDVVEGSEKVKIEVRDQITGLVINFKAMKANTDYEIDYKDGRILFWRPVPFIAEAYRIVSTDILDGNPVYVIVDYEYSVKDALDESTVGFRAQQAVTDHLVVGSTYVKENQPSSDYQLRGLDTTLHLGPDATLTAEYAETQAEVLGSFISTDGGLTFTQIVTSEASAGRAYGIQGEARLFNRLGLKGHYKWIENDFSTTPTVAQQGKELIGLDVTYDLTPWTRITARHDIQTLLDDGNLQTQQQVGASQTTTTLMQIVHDARRLKLTGEYRREELKERLDQFATETRIPEDILAIRADYLLTDQVTVSVERQEGFREDALDRTTLALSTKPYEWLELRVKETFGPFGLATQIGGTANVKENLALSADYTVLGDARSFDGLAEVGAAMKLNEKTEIETTLGLKQTGDGQRAVTVAVGGTTQVNEQTSLKTKVELTEEQKILVSVGGNAKLGDEKKSIETSVETTEEHGKLISVGGTTKVGETTTLNSAIKTAEDETTITSVGAAAQVDEQTYLKSNIDRTATPVGEGTTLSLGAVKKVDENTEVTGSFIVDQTPDGAETQTVGYGSKKKLRDDVTLTSQRTLTTTAEDVTTAGTYGIAYEKDGKKLEGTMSRTLKEASQEVSRTNIYGLTGAWDDKWALSGSYERGDVQSLTGAIATRDSVSLGVGYVEKDLATDQPVLKSSNKIEYRQDSGSENTRHYLVYSTIEGKITLETTLFGKIEISRTRNLTSETTAAQHKEMMLGAAYRPVQLDQLNLLARYTYLEEQGPQGQEDTAKVIEEQAHIISTEAVYDIDERWQIIEKVAVRIQKERAEGFEFTQTRTWLAATRLNYKIDEEWTIGGEMRILTQIEAEDQRRGYLIEAARKFSDNAKVGFGYNFSDFSDDLTSLDYTAHGPFVRITGTLYDRTAEEIERSKAKWLENKITQWAWKMVEEELLDPHSQIVRELNDLFSWAEKAYQAERYEEAQRIYKDIIISGQMMFEEAATFVRQQIAQEERLKELYDLATQYFEAGELIKARKIWEKIVEEAQLGKVN